MERLNDDMFACGQHGLPKTIACTGRTWHLERTFKHDFFACTGLYRCRESQQRCVLKISRLQPFWGISLAGVGRFLRNRELKIIRDLQDIKQVPQLLGTFGRNGLIYQYIDGKSLDERPVLPDHYFLMLSQLLEAIHARHISYMDLNKRGNILIGTDDRPYLIDFQISLRLPGTWLGGLRQCLQQADHYHLLKHKRKFRPDLMTETEWTRSRQPGRLISLHRSIGNPYRTLRRQILRFLYNRQILQPPSDVLPTPENDHHRFLS